VPPERRPLLHSPDPTRAGCRAGDFGANTWQREVVGGASPDRCPICPPFTRPLFAHPRQILVSRLPARNR
jgi:hypothetical protein